MLVLSRKRNQTLVIHDEATGEDLVIKVLNGSTRTHLGISASKRFRVLRGELANVQSEQELKGSL